MRETVADPALARHAGRFVWLELDFDKPENQGFIVRHDVTYTPSLYVLDPTDERAAAAHFGGMTLPELNRFLDQGERVVEGRAGTPAAAALARGDALLGSGRPGHAAAAYRAAIQQLMHAAQSHGDADTVARWGGRWLDEIEATVPASDDERTALDIARVDAVGAAEPPIGEGAHLLKLRGLPALVRRDCPECPEMVVVPAGKSLMSSPPVERGRRGFSP